MAESLLPESLRQVGEDNAEVVAPPPLFFLLPLVAGVALGRFVPFALAWPAWSLAAGLVLVAAAVGLFAWAARSMEKAGTTPLPARPSTAIVERGPYAFSRNPMYLGMTLLYLGVALATGSVLAFALLPLALVGLFYGVVRREERYLERKFGAAYLDYKGRVRRWL